MLVHLLQEFRMRKLSMLVIRLPNSRSGTLKVVLYTAIEH